MSNETAMLLTQQEWEDLARMVEHYRNCTEWVNHPAGNHAVEASHASNVRRCRKLATRIIEAV